MHKEKSHFQVEISGKKLMIFHISSAYKNEVFLQSAAHVNQNPTLFAQKYLVYLKVADFGGLSSVNTHHKLTKGQK